MTTNEEYGIGYDNDDNGADGGYGGDGGGYENEQLSESEQIKMELLKGILGKNINLTSQELEEITNIPAKKIETIREDLFHSALDDATDPLSWDYVFVFDVGSETDKHMPTKTDKKGKSDEDLSSDAWTNGISQKKYFGQVVAALWQRLKNPEKAKLSVKLFKSSDDKLLFLVAGITEKNLKWWADYRDTDLLIDPKGGVEYGRTRKFALATRTKLQLNDDEKNDENNSGGCCNCEDAFDISLEETLDLSNWNYLFAEYSQTAPQSVYKHYPRHGGTRGDDEIKTPFDEKTRLRIIYEAIIADQNDNGAEIKIVECIQSKKHPLKAVFPLHNQEKLDHFTATWIKNCKPQDLMWCPLTDIRNYFGEPVAFYFGFLQFYLKWLIAPAIVGIIFFVWQLAMGEIAVVGVPLLCFFIIFWSVAFVDFWARQESRYRLMWGMTKFQTKAVARPQFDGKWQHNEVDGQWAEEYSFWRRSAKAAGVFSTLIVWLGLCIFLVVYILMQRDTDPNNLVLKILLGVANGVMIAVFDAIYKLVSKHGNEWENHKTEQDFQNALIAKSFFFKFFNSFASLFYLGFVRPFVYGVNYYIRYYSIVCGTSPQYISQWLASGTASADDAASRYGAGKITDCIAASSACDVADCTAYTDDCIGNIDENDDWAVAIDGYAATDISQCPDGLIDFDGKSASEYFPDYQRFDSVNNWCGGGCSSVTTLTEQNEAVLSELQIQLLTLFLTATIIQNTLEVFLPFVGAFFKGRKRAKDAAANGQETESSEAELQSDKAAYENTIDDMSEMVVQFGYVTLFVMAFPLTPLLAIFNNVIEMKVDATNLCKTSQRPHPNGSYGLGTWNGVLGFFSIISVGTNVGMITWRTKMVTEFFADGDDAGQWIFFSVLSVILALIVGVEKWIIPDVPAEVMAAIERQRVVESILVLGAAPDDSLNTPPDDDDGSIPFDPNAEFVDIMTVTDVIPHNNLMYFDSQSV